MQSPTGVTSRCMVVTGKLNFGKAYAFQGSALIETLSNIKLILRDNLIPLHLQYGQHARSEEGKGSQQLLRELSKSIPLYKSNTIVSRDPVVRKIGMSASIRQLVAPHSKNFASETVTREKTASIQQTGRTGKRFLKKMQSLFQVLPAH